LRQRCGASKLTGAKRITHHDLRHLFASRCIENSVDIPTVSRWLGHQDGGVVLFGEIEGRSAICNRATASPKSRAIPRYRNVSVLR